MKILYFTGTGNCLSVAKRFEAERLSIPKLIKNNVYEIEDDVVGIIYPVYAISIPDMVKKYIFLNFHLSSSIRLSIVILIILFKDLL